MNLELENEIIDDDLEVIELVNFGFPRVIYTRKDHFNDFDDLSFFQRFRLTKNTVRELLVQIEYRLEYPYETNNSVSPINQLLMTLRYYATGNHLQSIADFSGVHTSTACRVIKRVSVAVAELANLYIHCPDTPEEVLEKQRQFFEIAAFPRIVGVVDGTHIRIQSPGGNDPEVFRNRKHYFSVNVQVVGDAKLKIMDIVARWPGSAHDATIFNSSNIKMRFDNDIYNNSCLLGDSAYNIRPYLLTPLLNPRRNNEQRYNESHIRTRGVIEKLFGVWKRRFPVLAHGCRLQIENTLTVIVATAVLHNIARDMGKVDPPVDEEQNQHLLNHLIAQQEIPAFPLLIDGRNNNGNHIRQTLIDNYFN